MHQKHFTRLYLSTINQAMIGGAMRGEEGRAFRIIERRGERRELRRRHHDLIGVPAVPKLHDHAIADGHIGRVLHLDDIAGRFHARRERQLRLELIFAGRHQDIGKIDSGRADGDAHLPRRERHRLKAFESQAFGRAELAAHDFFGHQAARSLRRARTSRTSGSRSLPKYMSVLSTKIVGEPNPPRAITSSVLALSWSLMDCWPMPAKNRCASTPTRLQTSDSTASCEMS